MEYIGKIEHDQKLCMGENGIVIFGAGGQLENLLNKLENLHVRDKVVCICDNNPEKCGKEMEGIKIVGPEYAFSHYGDYLYIVYNQFRLEICRKLADRKIQRIHLIRD